VPRIVRTVVSTDSEEIAQAARAAGAEAPFLRPSSLATDDAPTMPVLTHALSELERDGGRFGSVLLLEPTSPLRLPSDIVRALEVLDRDSGADGVVACSRPKFNPFWVGVVERDGYLHSAFEGADQYDRRQDVPPFYRINGVLYLWRAGVVRSAPTRWRKLKNRMLEIPESRAVSIDDMDELRVAELTVKNRMIRLPWLDSR
jgi:N-acylneuraminate cytidylyltransferase